MNHEQLSLSSRNAQEFQRLFTRVESQERLLCDIRKHATDKQKRLVRDMMRDLFEKGVSSDDDEQLMSDLQRSVPLCGMSCAGSRLLTGRSRISPARTPWMRALP